MECRTLYLTLVAAKGFEIEKKAGLYAVASVSSTDGTVQMFKTPIDKTGARSFPMKFTVSEFDWETQNLEIRIKAERMLADRNLGKACVPIRELLDGVTTQGKPMHTVIYQVSRTLEFTFTYTFGEMFLQKPVVVEHTHQDTISFVDAGCCE